MTIPTITCWDETTLEFPDRRMDVLIAADGTSLVGLRFGTAADHAAWLGAARRDPGDPVIAAARTQLQAYAAGRSEVFDLPVHMEGTPFQKAVWEELRQIPYGSTRTYGAVAQAIGHPGHARAVGAAVGANPVGIIIPCHRVIGADGSLTGFAGGLDNKIALLAREGVTAL
jgi:methylated-DNA-[protein]-cysteine S-methyltransferase